MGACPRRYWLEQTWNGINQVSLEIMTAAGGGGGSGRVQGERDQEMGKLLFKIHFPSVVCTLGWVLGIGVSKAHRVLGLSY